jgi:cytochrome c5
VSASHDRKFFDTFMLILGMLLGITMVLIILARLIARDPVRAVSQADPVLQGEIAARITPVAKVAVAGQDNSALATAAPVTVAAVDLGGEEVYNQACVACHGAGVAGAPKFGDAGAWASRVAQGNDTLYKHALEGFQGKGGYMPPKGGRADLSDQSIMNAVDYLVAKSR